LQLLDILPAAIRARVEPRLPVIREILIFGMVGGSGTVVDGGILTVAIHLGAGPYLGRVFGIFAAIVWTWLLNRSVTFSAWTRPTFGEFARYFGISLIGACINYGVYSTLIHYGWPILAGVVIGTLVAASFNFVFYRTILRRKADPALAEQPLDTTAG
jgi:putative flippase GtrA